MLRRPPVILAGPAFIASVAYVDPGNVATNSVAGATSGYALAWVVIGAGLMAMPVQYVAARPTGAVNSWCCLWNRTYHHGECRNEWTW